MHLTTKALSLAALALSASAISQPSPVDFLNSAAAPGSWSYRTTATGSEAAFMDAGAVRRLVISCRAATRVVSLSLTSTTTAPMINVWTTDAARALPARFDARTFQLGADIAARDSLLDAIAFSDRRFALSFAGAAPLIVPTSPEAARAIEDCRG